MKVLVTGAGGFIGAHVARLLAARGDEVRFGLAPGERESVEGAEIPGDRRVFDVRDLPAVRAAVDGVEAVIHLAAVYSTWTRDARPMYQVNVQGTGNVRRAATDAGVRRVVHTSSIAAIGLEPGGRPSTEGTSFNQHGKAIHYALSKYYSERVALRFAAAGAPVVVVNPAFPFGVGDRRPTPTGRIIVNILKGTYFGYGPGGLNAVEVEDVARGHLLALDSGVPGRRYLLTGHDISWADFYALVKRVGDVSRVHVRLPYAVLLGMGLLGDIVGRFSEPLIDSRTVRYSAQDFCYDCSRARAELGYTVAPLEAAVKRAVDWFRAEGYA